MVATAITTTTPTIAITTTIFLPLTFYTTTTYPAFYSAFFLYLLLQTFGS